MKIILNLNSFLRKNDLKIKFTQLMNRIIAISNHEAVLLIEKQEQEKL